MSNQRGRRTTGSDLNAIRRRWSTAHDRGADDYSDEGCRVLAEHAFRDVFALLDEVHDGRKRVAGLQFAAYEAAQVIGNLVENGPEQGFGYWNEAGHWRDGEKILSRLTGMSWMDGVDAPEDAPCPDCGGSGCGRDRCNGGCCKRCDGTGYQPLPDTDEEQS